MTKTPDERFAGDAGLPTADDVRGIIPRSTPAQDATALADRIDLGLTVDYEGFYSPPLCQAQWRMIATALRALQQSPATDNALAVGAQPEPDWRAREARASLLASEGLAISDEPRS